MFNAFSKTLVGAAALAALTAVALPASAQSYGYYDRGNGRNDGYNSYEQCRDSRNRRQVGGALIGGTLGAVAGNQIGGRGNRTGGGLIGGVLGAAVGAGVGGSSRDCSYYGDSSYTYDRYDDRRYDDQRYDDRYYDDRYRDDRYSDNRYDDRRYYQDRRYDNGSYNGGYDRRYDYDSYTSSSGGYSYGCRTVQSTTYDWQGRAVTSYRQEC